MFNIMSSTASEWSPHLPIEIWQEIFHHVNSVEDLKNASLTCKLFNSLSMKHLWILSKSRVRGNQMHDCKDLPIQNLIMYGANGEYLLTTSTLLQTDV